MSDQRSQPGNHWLLIAATAILVLTFENFLVGRLSQPEPAAPDGLAPECLKRADRSWSLSPLTLPHALVRVLVAEQIYRAMSLLGGHPYHRA